LAEDFLVNGMSRSGPAGPRCLVYAVSAHSYKLTTRIFFI
jgi:hypothetical protein